MTSPSANGLGSGSVIAAALADEPSDERWCLAPTEPSAVRHPPWLIMSGCVDPFRTLDEPLFDHLIGGREEGRRHGEAKGLGGPEIDDELEVSRLLNRKIGRLCSFETLPDVDTNLAIDRGEARPVTDKAACCGKFLPLIDRRNGVTRLQCHEQQNGMACVLLNFEQRCAKRSKRPDCPNEHDARPSSDSGGRIPYAMAASFDVASGTFETCRLHRAMSAFRGNPENIS